LISYSSSPFPPQQITQGPQQQHKQKRRPNTINTGIKALAAEKLAPSRSNTIKMTKVSTNASITAYIMLVTVNIFFLLSRSSTSVVVLKLAVSSAIFTKSFQAIETNSYFVSKIKVGYRIQELH
jgi:hypothetical protein